MIMKTKRNLDETSKSNEDHSPKKPKLSGKNKGNLDGKPSKFQKDDNADKSFNKKKYDKTTGKPFKKNFDAKASAIASDAGKPVDWNEFKKKKKEEQKKRKEGKNLYELVIQAKKIGEKLRRKTLKGGEEERTNLTNELHGILGGQGHYPKLVMTHDMARIVQYLLKFGSLDIRKDIANELKSIVFEMLQSKYAKYCVKRMLKYGDAGTRAAIIQGCYGHVVKLASHAVSAAIFDFAYSNCATPLQRQHILQEFFGDMYKQSKDDSLKHMRDVYEKSPEMKTATLSAVKANLQRILNKTLLDSHLVQSILMQFLQECNQEDRTDLIAQLLPHLVILSNSKEGARVVMMILWHGTNKDRKTAVKLLKEHAIDLCKHEHAHCAIIAAMDALDDTVHTTRILLSDVIKKCSELAADEWARRVLLWIVAPGDTAHFHPAFIKELDEGRRKSTCKKEVHTRRTEILTGLEETILKQIADEPNKWLANSSVAVVTLAVLKAANGEHLSKAQEQLAKVITDLEFKVKDGDTEICGIEHSGLHMILKKIICHDKNAMDGKPLFGDAVVKQLNDDIIEKWVKLNRGCFLFVFILESDGEEVSNKLKELLEAHKSLIKKQNTTGAKILLKKLN